MTAAITASEPITIITTIQSIARTSRLRTVLGWNMAALCDRAEAARFDAARFDDWDVCTGRFASIESGFFFSGYE
ncbi:MAG: hypothetical protein ABL934_12350 [Lysobacteraceae bacterium]